MAVLITLLGAGIITLAALLWMPSILIWPWIGLIRRRTESRTEDATAEALEPPAPVSEAMRQLDALGFKRVGELKTYTRRGTGVSWNMVSREGTVMAELVPYLDGYAAAFSTAFEDESVVETGYRIGETFKTRLHVSGFTRESLEAAYDLHTRNVEAFTRRRSSPAQRLDSMQAIIRHDTSYRKRHYQRKLLRPLMRGVWLTLFLLIPSALAVYELSRVYFALRTGTGSLELLGRQMGPSVLIGGLSLVGFFLMLRKFYYHAGK